jgi:hypothetical protein
MIEADGQPCSTFRPYDFNAIAQRQITSPI